MVRFRNSCWSASLAGIAVGGAVLLAMRLLAGAVHPPVDDPRAVPAPLAARGAIWPCSQPAPGSRPATWSAASDPRPLQLLALQVALDAQERRP